ncbi:hypothetical protein BZA70DRAFT_256117 [Myxozyma melibiosi]|uniref:1-phosphatidylinositol 4-kinase n=1 Tax=Myxozyma melibiosi TaxID=54550 RepID=A0ABR1F8W2_9ASCO
MESYGIPRATLRSVTLERLATFSAKNSQDDDLDKLLLALRASGNIFTHRSKAPTNGENHVKADINGHALPAPMTANELQVLLSLASSVQYIRQKSHAKRLLDQLGTCLAVSHQHRFENSAYITELFPSPWEVVSEKLTLAILDIGHQFTDLQAIACDYLNKYLESLKEANKSLEAPFHFISVFPLSFSLHGFISAFMKRPMYYSDPDAQMALLNATRGLFEDDMLLKLEESMSMLRTSNHSSPSVSIWMTYRRNYRAIGKVLGSLSLRYSYMEMVRHIAGLYVLKGQPEEICIKDCYLDTIMAQSRFVPHIDDRSRQVLKTCCEIAMGGISVIEEGLDYVNMSSSRQRRVTFALKASALEVLCIGNILEEFPVDDTVLLLENALTDEDQIVEEVLISRIFKIMALLCKKNSDIGSSLTRIFPRLLVRYSTTLTTIQTGTVCVAYALHYLSEDAVISTLYTFANILVLERANSPSNNRAAPKTVTSNGLQRVSSMGSSISLISRSEEELNIIYENVIHALARIMQGYGNPKMTALTISVLVQKIGRVNDFIDRCLVLGLVSLACSGTEREFKSILKLYSRLSSEAIARGDKEMADAVLEAQVRIAKNMDTKNQYYELYLRTLLIDIASKGDVRDVDHHRHKLDVRVPAEEISYLITPLASLLPPTTETRFATDDEELLTAFRNAWFNMAVHGYNKESEWVLKHANDLEVIAWSSPPLVSEKSSNLFESELDINTVLHRGSHQHDMNEQRQKVLTSFAPAGAVPAQIEYRSLTFPKLIFLSAALLLESLRASAGDCSKVQLYFLDPSFRSGETSKIISGIANEVMRIYLQKVLAKSLVPMSPSISGQLRELLILCCHRIQSVSISAFESANKIIANVPSSLCRKESLFTLLELLTLLWNSCLDEDVDQYSPRSIFTSAKTKIRLELSDSYSNRKATLKMLHGSASKWVQLAIDTSPLDVKGLLQSYLADMDDFRAFGHVSLGRSFAVDMGGRISFTDNKLASIGHPADVKVDTISDFLTQYTWRQIYRRGESVVPGEHDENTVAAYNSIKAVLVSLQDRVSKKRFVSIAELREGLLRTAEFILECKKYSAELVHYVVHIPFMVFSKQSIKLGVSLWLWLLNEAPQLQSRILAEIALGFEWSIRRREGLYSTAHDLTPVLNLKMEYAPSNKEEIMHDARIAVNSFAPHLYVVEMLASHFQSSKFQSLHLFEIFERSLRIALLNMAHGSYHPLVRQNRFNIILFSLKLLEGYSSLSSQRSTFFKNLVLTAALTWFSKPPGYPFGGNRLQLKSEFRLLLDVYQRVKTLRVNGPEKALFLDVKKELLLQFLSHEVYGMSIWLDPLGFVPYRELKQQIPKRSFEPSAEMIIVAWEIDPGLAISYAKRFKRPEVEHQLRQLVIADTIRAADVADALPYLIDGQVKENGGSEFKYLLFWAPATPIDAINYFMPNYGRNTLMMQYAMRSLESHSVDVTFFYVPQIVQMLRHDERGYIERFILETAKLDQLFAHQIIWNMKSNAYKDEDSTIPDSIKPSLDRVMELMISSFAGSDRDFYEREFSFFNEVTSISGKLKPYIRKSKAEKKAKIDEEMRKIKVDVGVYLPSNPDGTVIGIDRKSGRPLQSHAKAPFMATFQIRKNVKTINTIRLEGEDESESMAVETIERWMSAIFKVGDDCRQDLLALQLIALFRNIFNASGLDLYLFPYRVIATAPGCGVIDVLPNSISRDMLGREAVNGLYEYFISKHGSEDSIKFQQVRNNFVQSMAAYSVISYLLQFKDRHNGNIMYDDQGHVLHIDFGFCFDIVPGGVKFEAAPFKLTHEMVQVMGGRDTQAYRWFEELCIKAFLACRPHAESIIRCVYPMLESGLPCFKGETTIRNLRDRFALDKTDKEAAVHMRGLIKKSAESLYTRGYDEFQRVTNGIPY